MKPAVKKVGRPATGRQKMVMTISIDKDLKEWIQSQPEKNSALIARGIKIIKKLNEEKQNEQ